MQIYKIYINEKPLLILSTADLYKANFDKTTTLVVRHTGQPKSIFQCIDTLEKGTIYQRVALHGESYRELKKAVKSLFIVIKAGGGLVMNERDEALFIFRRGYWDLPKGKVDPGESYKVAAMREVEEETGISKLKITKLLRKTKHVYKSKTGKRILKLTAWYLMTTFRQPLTPQLDEDIELAEWLKIDHFLANHKPVYQNIVNVIENFSG